MRRTILILTILSFFFYDLSGQAKKTPIQSFVSNSALKHASVSVSVKDFSGKSIVSHNPYQSLTPASILKVITTATAMETMGPTFRYKTTLAKDKNNPNRLLIHGYGDPTLGSERIGDSPHEFLGKWSEQILGAFGNEEAIDVTVVDDYFGYESVSQKWIREDIGNYFAPGVYGVSVFDNTYRLHLNTMRSDTLPIVVKTVPFMKNMTFYNTLSQNTTGVDAGFIVGEPLSDERTLLGDIPARKSSFVIKGGIPNPGMYLGETVAESLKEKGMDIVSVSTNKDYYDQQRVLRTKKSIEEEIFYIHQSPTISEIVREVNVRSNNHYAEHLIRSIGRHKNQDIYSSALGNGIEQVNELWTAKGLDTDALFMYDGCGLAPSNAVSADFMTDVLLYMQTKSSNADAFLQSLPKAGVDGTVRGLLKGSRLAGKVYVKSGSIANVRCYAGYYINGEKKYAFTIMVNNYNSSYREVVRAIEKLLLDVL